jgi:RNA polymerase sigma-70 factor (ECF subfamily)
MTDDWITTAVSRYEAPLRLYATRLLGDADRAGDMVQDAFLQLCRQPRAEVEPKLGPWLFAVVRRRVVDLVRKEHRMTALDELPLPAREMGPADRAETNDSARKLLVKLHDLPAKQHEAVRLKFQNQFSYREIAEVMGLSESHVGVLLHQALKSLRAGMA